MSVLVTAILAAWLALSIVNQFRPGRFRWCRGLLDWVFRYDVLYLIPDYPFFAPYPVTLDYELLYRDRLADGSVTAWRALEFSSNSVWRAIWNPRKRQSRRLMTLCVNLSRQARLQIEGRLGPDEIYLSEPYVGLAQCIAAAPHSIAGLEAQFLIAVNPGVETRKAPAIVFVSPLFRL